MRCRYVPSAAQEEGEGDEDGKQGLQKPEGVEDEEAPGPERNSLLLTATKMRKEGGVESELQKQKREEEELLRATTQTKALMSAKEVAKVRCKPTSYSTALMVFPSLLGE